MRPLTKEEILAIENRALMATECDPAKLGHLLRLAYTARLGIATKEALEICEDQMEYYKCELEVPTSWQDVHRKAKKTLALWESE